MDMAVNTEILREIGLSENEIKVYISLIRLGPSSATDIMKKSGVHRANVYDSLEKLSEKGLVSNVFRLNKNYFESASPKNLSAILKEREKQLESIIPELEAIYKQSREKEEILHFKGKEGVKAVLRDINKHKSYDAFGISSNLAEIVGYYFVQWIRERAPAGFFS